MAKKVTLGRGLDALLSEASLFAVQQQSSLPASQLESGNITKLALARLVPNPYQPRTDFNPEALKELANSIKAQGVIQPLLVRIKGTGEYEIIAGERRWRAAKSVGLTEVPVLIRELSDEAALALALVENLQREDLSVIELAKSIRQLIDEFNFTHDQAAKILGKSRETISNLLRMLVLPPEIQTLLQGGFLEMGHARALITLNEIDQLRLAKLTVQQGLSVRKVEELAQKIRYDKIGKLKRSLAPTLLEKQKVLAERLATKIKFIPLKEHSGELVIHFKNSEELDRILAHIT